MSNVSDEISVRNSEEIEKPIGILSEAIENLSVKNDNSNETTETKLPPNLSDMPNEVVSLIIERSEYKEQLILRKVSKSMRSLVDKSKPDCGILNVGCGIDFIRCHYNNQKVIYAANKECDYISLSDSETVTIVRDDYENVAFDDLKWTLNNPKLQLEIFFYYHDYDDEEEEVAAAIIDKKMETMLKCLSNQISVKQFDVGGDNVSSMRVILPYLKPGFLDTIVLGPDIYGSDTTLTQYIGEISLLDHWKQAQELHLYNFNGINLNLMKYANHFKRFYMEPILIEENELISLRDHFSALASFEYCTIRAFCNFDIHSVVMAVGFRAPPNEQTMFMRHYSIPSSDKHLEFLFRPPNERTDFVSHYSIPDSNSYLEFLFFQGWITIEKKNRLNCSI